VADLGRPGIAVIEGAGVAIIVVERFINALPGLFQAVICGAGIVIVAKTVFVLGQESAVILTVINAIAGIARIYGTIHTVIARRYVATASSLGSAAIGCAILFVITGNGYVVAVPVFGVAEIHGAEVIVIAIVVGVETALLNNT